MTSHLTQKKPSLAQRFFYQLGLVDIHTKVNCWFCNQDSYLLPGTRNTIDHWFCTLCENTNRRDENGEIIDPSPFQMEPTYKVRPTVSPSSLNNGNKQICADCQRGYIIVYRALSEYLPDESDPTYQERLENVSNEKKRLQSKYSLCKDCVVLSDKVLNDSARSLKVQNISNLVYKSLQENTVTKRPTRVRYYTKGIIWTLTHLWIFLFVYFATMHPPRNDLDWDLLSLKFLKLVSWRKCVDLKAVSEYLTTKIDMYKNLAACFFYVSSTANVDCEWNLSDGILFFAFANLFSLVAIDWHYNMTPIIFEKVKNFKYYKNIQWGLFFFRITLVSLIALGIDWKFVWFFLLTYFVVLLKSNNLVTVGFLNFDREVQNSFCLPEDEAPIEAMEDIEMSITSEEPITTTNATTNTSINATPNTTTNATPNTTTNATPNTTTEPDDMLNLIDRLQIL